MNKETLESLKNHKEYDDKIDQLLRDIFLWTDNQARDYNFNDIDNLFKSIDTNLLAEDIMVGLIMATHRMRKHLNERNNFIDKCYDSLVIQIGKEEASNLIDEFKRNILNE